MSNPSLTAPGHCLCGVLLVMLHAHIDLSIYSISTGSSLVSSYQKKKKKESKTKMFLDW